LKFKPGDELIVSGIDHEANVASWVSISERLCLTLKWWLPKDKQNPKLQPEDLKELISDRTRLVTCTHASNILGTIHDIKAIAKVVHAIPGAQLCVDAVAYAPHRRIDVIDLGADFYAFSWYKVRPHIKSSTSSQNQNEVNSYFHRYMGLTSPCSMAASPPKNK
jgi:selenocysteine lyase/cysteine desulfurase